MRVTHLQKNSPEITEPLCGETDKQKHITFDAEKATCEKCLEHHKEGTYTLTEGEKIITTRDTLLPSLTEILTNDA